jgi:hypothetical protein
MPTCPLPAAVRRLAPALFMLGLAAVAPAHAADGLAAAAALPAVTVSSYPVPMLDVDGQSKYVAVVAAHGVEIRRCQHMVVTKLNYLACELNEGARSYNVIIPIVREAVDVRQPWSYFESGVYR